MTKNDSVNLTLMESGGDCLTHRCGHKAVIAYEIHTPHGVLTPTPQMRIDRDRCGACMLAHLIKTVTHCTECGTMILTGMPCFMYQESLKCTGRSCSPGPTLAEPGTWIEGQFVPYRPVEPNVIIAFR